MTAAPLDLTLADLPFFPTTSESLLRTLHAILITNLVWGLTLVRGVRP